MQIASNTGRVVSRAPGKLVVLGEYAVLNGAPAMVLAVDRHCRAEIGPSEDDRCHLVSRADADRLTSFPGGGASGFGVVDEVLSALPAAGVWRGLLDSREFFANGVKLGLGSSAAALTAWAAAWAAFTGRGPLQADSATLQTLIGLHRATQGGAGSGIDVAASLFGGVVRFQLDGGALARAGTVRLPNSVGFAGVFTRSAASTPGYLARYEAWRAEAPGEADALHGVLAGIAEGGIGAALADDADAFLMAVAEYGHELARLGERIGAQIVTPAHRGVLVIAERLGVAYKVSGAGGGDLGLAFSADDEALRTFEQAVEKETECDVIELEIDPGGLSVEIAAS